MLWITVRTRRKSPFWAGLLGIITCFLFLLIFGRTGYIFLFCFWFLACYIFRLVRYLARVFGIHLLESAWFWESIVFFYSLPLLLNLGFFFVFVHALMYYDGHGYDYDYDYDMI